MADVPETGVDRPYASGPTNCRFESCPSHQPNAAAVERIRAYLDAMQVYFHGENTIIHTVTTPTDSTMRRLTLADLREAFDGFSEGNKDTARLDWLEKEMERELVCTATVMFPRPLFRRNMPITRAAIDEAMEAK